MKGWLRTRLRRLHRKLNYFFGRYAVSGELRFLRNRVKELEAGENRDIQYLRFQLAKARAENNDLQSRTDDLWEKFSALLNMTEDQLRELACRYDIWEAGSPKSWFVAVDHCVFCGCGLQITAFRSERDALLYAVLLQTVGYRPKHNLSCPSCYDEYEKSTDLVNN